jgi:hypothetical protein
VSPAPPNSLKPVRSLPVLAWCLGLVALGWFYAWSPGAFRYQWLTREPVSFYHEQTEGFLAGHLYLARAPDPRLVALPDPYDPVANAPSRVNDLSYHAGRYFFYPSAVPVLTLFAPVRLLTGEHLGEPAACMIFSLAGFAFAAAFLLTLRRHFFPHCPVLLTVCALAALAFCQGYYVVLRAVSYNHVPIACAYGWAMLALLAALRALVAPERRRTAWLAAASLAYALAIASRPNYLPGACALLVPVLGWWRTDGWRPTRRLLGHLLALGLPMAVVAGALLAYNSARFDSPWEFGMRLQLGAWDQRTMSGLALENVPENAYHYLVSPVVYHPSFPFVTAPSWTALGVLLHVPFILLGALLPWLASTRRLSFPARAALTLPLLVAGANLGFLLLFPSGNEQAVRTSANARYLFDFLPAAVLLASGCLVAAGTLLPRAGLRWLLGLGSALALLLSVLAAVSLDFSRYPAEAYRPLARLLSSPAWWWEQARGIKYGPLELEVILPANRIGAYEPLLATGTAQAGELVYVFYEAPGQIRLGLVGTEIPGPLSGPILLDFAQPHRLEFHLGSLYPTDAHPLMSAYGEAQIATLKRRLVVKLDGRLVFTAPAYFHPNEGGRFEIGRAPFLRAYSQEKFTGKIISVTRQAVTPPAGLEINPPVYGALRLRVSFPVDRANFTEPLVATGIPQAGDVLHVTYRPDGAIRLGLDHWGQRGLLSDWLAVDPHAEHVLEFASGALYPPADHVLLAALSPDERLALKEQVHLTLDGRTVFAARLPAYESSPYDVVVGRNAIGSSTSVYAFTGRILEVTRVPLAPVR